MKDNLALKGSIEKYHERFGGIILILEGSQRPSIGLPVDGGC